MKRCPECRRDYYDDTLLYCLDDGNALLEGPAAGDAVVRGADGPATAILPEFAVPLLAGPASEAATRDQIPTAGTAAAPYENNHRSAEKQSRFAGRAVKPLVALIVAVLLLVGGFFGYKYVSPAKQIESIAVLPFENASGDPGLDYLSEGVSESVIDRLSQLGQLKVIARTSSFRYRDPNPDLKAIADALGVQTIVTGRIARRGDNYLIRVDLTDVGENKQLWGDNFNRQISDVLTVPEEIAQTVTENLKLKLNGTQGQMLAKHETNNAEAYELVLKGRFFARKGGTESRKKAIEFLNQAIIADPNYALAYAVLAARYNSLINNSIGDPKEFLPKAEAAAQRALELDETLAEAHYAQAIVKSSMFEWAESERQFSRAIELNPNLARGHGGFAQYLSLRGRHDQAIAEINRAKTLDPLSPVINANVAFILYSARRYDEAIDVLKRMLDVDRSYAVAQGYLADAYLAKQRYAEAIALYQEAIKLGEDSTGAQIKLGVAYARSGARSEALTVLRQMQASEHYVSPAELAKLYESLGQHDDAIALLEKAFVDRDVQLQYLGVDAAYDGLRGDARFADLLGRIGLSQGPR